jgi:hypothetical protein
MKIIWSDESKFSLINPNRIEYYWKEKPAPLVEENVKRSKKFGGGGVMTWGCITSRGVGELIRLDGIVDSKKYINVLSDCLMKTLEKYELNPKKVTFMQDNAAIHTAKNVLEWLSINKIKVVDWLARSPDVNPIKKSMDNYRMRIKKTPKKPTNADELWELIKEEWSKIDQETIRKLYLSVTKRVHGVYTSKGGYVKY